MISVSVLSAGQAENYYDKDDLYHAGKEIDGGRIPDTMKFDSELGIVNEFISKEEFKNMIAENEKFRTIEFKINLSPEFKEFLKTDQKFIETFNKNFEKSIRAQAKISGIVLKENSFGYTKDGIITGVTSHNISKEKFSEKFSKINLEKVGEQISSKLKKFSETSDNNLFDGTTQPFKVSSQMHTGRIGIDLTFSTSKSISLMRYASPEHKAIIEEAHRAALGNVLKHINQEYAVARIQVEGESKMIHGQLDTYIFNHEQSRLNDPEFHTHVVVANRMECEDGQIRSIEPRDILREQKTLGKYYRMELDRELLSRGIKTDITDREQYFVEVKGVPEEMRKEASGRRQEIEAEWERRGLDSGDTHGKGKAVLETRNAKKDADLSLLAEKWGPRMEALQIGIGAPIRAEFKAPDQVIKEIEKSTYHFTEREFLQKYKENDPHARIEDIKAEFKSRVSSGEIFTAEKDGQKFYATRGTLENEALIKENVFNGVKSSWHLNKRDLEGVDLGGLTKGQRNAIFDTMATRNQYHAVEGDAGSGKTYMLDYMRQVCEQNNIEIKGMAPSNNAVEGMRKESGIDAETIHKFLGNLEYESLKAVGKYPDKVEGIKQEWDFSAVQKTSKKEIWVVDESSMLDNRMARQITEAAKARGAKVLLIGDPKQLQAVGPGNAYTNLIKDKYLGCTRMQEVMRQKDIWHIYGKEKLTDGQMAELRQEAKNENAILKVHPGHAKLETVQKCEPRNARSVPGQMVYVDSRLRLAVDKLASGQSVKSSLDLLADSTKEISKKSERLKTMAADFIKTYDPQKINSVALVATNSDRKNLNWKIRHELKNVGLLSDGFMVDVTNQKGKSEKIEIAPGDRIMSLGKHQAAGAENGTRFIVRGISEDGQIITLEKDGEKTLKTVDVREFNKFTHAYAVTVHKAQGMSIDHVYANLDTTQKNFSYRNNLYVNLSRAKEGVNVYTNDQAGAAKAFDKEKLNLSLKDFSASGHDPFAAPKLSELKDLVKHDPFKMDQDLIDLLTQTNGIKNETKLEPEGLKMKFF